VPYRISRVLVSFLLLCVALGSRAAPVADAQQQQLLVYAAASLTNAMEEIGTAYEKKTRVAVKFSFDASSTLARQIEAAAPADVFFSADTDWMGYLQQRSLIKQASRRDLLGNTLVLIAPAGSRIQLKIAPHFPLAAALGDGHLATGDPDSVPAGRYARSALTALGVWNEVASRIVRAENVRTALSYVSRGEAPLGIVYGSDALVDKGVRVVDTFPANTHQPIVYPVALTRSAHGEAADFVAYLASAPARDIFIKYGFTVLAR
jgi:molybdate transport system substrate-binding protein